MAIRIIKGRPFSPFFIFVEGGAKYSDRELMARFGLELRDGDEAGRTREIHFAQDERWLHIMDGWFYGLWYNPRVGQVLQELARHHRIYACCVGDCDDSLEFVYYADNQIQRHYRFEDPSMWDGRGVVIDDGAPLPGELEARAGALSQDELGLVLKIAEGLGIRPVKDGRRARSYSYTHDLINREDDAEWVIPPAG